MAKKLRIRQVKSIIGSQKKHKLCMRALGFRRNYRLLYKEDNPLIRGMVKNVEHLVEWEEIDEKDIPSSSPVGAGFTVLDEGSASKTDQEG